MAEIVGSAANEITAENTQEMVSNLGRRESKILHDPSVVSPLETSDHELTDNQDGIEDQSIDDTNLQASLDAYEASQATPQNGEAATSNDAEPSVEEINWDSDRMSKLGSEFKDVFQFDLKDAFDKFQQLTEATQKLQAEQEQAVLRSSLSSLQEHWGVNEAELNARISRIVAHVEKMPPALKAQVDSVDGFKLMWDRIDAQSRTKKTSSKGSSSASSSPTTFRKSELATMMIREPERYQTLSPQIYQAYTEGRVTDD